METTSFTTKEKSVYFHQPSLPTASSYRDAPLRRERLISTLICGGRRADISNRAPWDLVDLGVREEDPGLVLVGSVLGVREEDPDLALVGSVLGGLDSGRVVHGVLVQAGHGELVLVVHGVLVSSEGQGSSVASLMGCAIWLLHAYPACAAAGCSKIASGDPADRTAHLEALPSIDLI
ncbi:hypothetical protein SAY86_016936 [Trapa natans]|uniref:Uncharacterized protein n=1 Tax=Trapa natans TaxID=22666 RepID=A0AAN7R4N7_TRANT|nr:hypothetical protein SAY86_016936 [Trapa natans]